MGRADGIHFGTGSPSYGSDGAGDPIFELLAPDAPTIVNEPEAQWHYAAIKARRPGGLTVWRASPAVRPAGRGWDAHAFSRDVFAGLDAHHERTGAYPSDVCLLNELNLNYERGDTQSDVEPSMWPGRYAKLALFLSQLLDACQERADDRGMRVRWWFPGWAPGHGHRDCAGLWAPVARRYGGVVLHAYRSVDEITDEALWYAQAFPDQDLLIGEWNTINYSGDRLVEEARIRSRLRSLCRDLPRLSACYFIWRWAEDRSHEHDIEGNDARRALWDGRTALPADSFHVPGSSEIDGEQPSTEPVSEAPVAGPYRLPAWTPAYADIRDGAIQVADEYHMPRRRLLGLCLAECGFGLQSFDRWASQERTKRMVAAIDARDWAAVEAVFAEIPPTGSNDLSFGPCHPAYWWSFTAEEQRAHPEWRYDLARIMEYRAKLIEDHGYALRKAADTLVALRIRFNSDDDQYLLERYNKPNAEVGAGVRANYERSLVEADRILAELFPSSAPAAPEPSESPQAGSGAVFESYPDPEPAGTFSGTPRGVILHGSRSGKAGNPKAAEYKGTAGYEVNNPASLGWNATIGEGVVAIHLSPRQWGWNARAASSKYLAVEFAQATVDEPITDAQVDAFCAWLTGYVLPVWPGLPFSFPTHAELDGTAEYGGTYDGKTDVFEKGSPRADDLRARIMARLEPAPVPRPAPQPEPAPPEPAPQPQATPSEPTIDGLLSAVAYLGDDVADRIERTRASLDDGVERPATDMTADRLRANLEAAWRNIDRVYAELGAEGDELRRVRAEQVGPRP